MGDDTLAPMDADERRVADLIRVGTTLARSIGHNPKGSIRCPKLSPAIPCTCGSEAQQARALSDWDELVEDIRRGT